MLITKNTNPDFVQTGLFPYKQYSALYHKSSASDISCYSNCIPFLFTVFTTCHQHVYHICL